MSNNSKKPKSTISKKDLKDFKIELTNKQNELFEKIKKNKIGAVTGPAGTSKTLTACYTALNMIANNKVERIILTKPIKESGENLGFLPGDQEEKTTPYMTSFFNNFYKILNKDTVDMMYNNEEIIVEPLAYMRGATYENSIMILDEAQNCIESQLMLWITRMGKNSKAILMGDTFQYDIRSKDSRLVEFVDMISDINGVFDFRFDSDDIMRDDILIEIVRRYEKNYHNNGNSKNK